MKPGRQVQESCEYRLILVEPEAREVLLLGSGPSLRLPKMWIPWGVRPTVELRKASKALWNIDLLVLDILPAQGDFPSCFIAELLGPNLSNELKPFAPEKIADRDLSDRQRADLVDVLCDRTESRFCQIGWIDEAIEWLESAVRRKISTKTQIQQLNAGGPFALVRFRTSDDGYYWLKATGGPNAHERSVTTLLSALGTRYLPKIISARPSWNAWLMSGDGISMAELAGSSAKFFRLLEDAVESMAELQLRTVGRRNDLLEAGAVDQTTAVLRRHSGELFEYLEEAMASQSSIKAPRLERKRLQELKSIVDKACDRTERLRLPDAIVHGDMNLGNILAGAQNCQFIDWCEAYFGHPFITLQHLLLLNQAPNPDTAKLIDACLRAAYRDVWVEAYDSVAIDAGFVYMPVLAAISSMLGRPDWITSPKRNDPRRQSYARRIARYLDRAVREPALAGALCN